MTLYLTFVNPQTLSGKLKILDEYIPSKNVYVITVLDGNNCTCQEERL